MSPLLLVFGLIGVNGMDYGLRGQFFEKKKLSRLVRLLSTRDEELGHSIKELALVHHGEDSSTSRDSSYSYSNDSESDSEH